MREVAWVLSGPPGTVVMSGMLSRTGGPSGSEVGLVDGHQGDGVDNGVYGSGGKRGESSPKEWGAVRGAIPTQLGVGNFQFMYEPQDSIRDHEENQVVLHGEGPVVEVKGGGAVDVGIGLEGDVVVDLEEVCSVYEVPGGGVVNETFEGSRGRNESQNGPDICTSVGEPLDQVVGGKGDRAVPTDSGFLNIEL
jgi:hypothetical protein